MTGVQTCALPISTDRGVWIYQHREKQVVYVPCKLTEQIKSGSSTGRAIYLALIPIATQIATWGVIDGIKGPDKDRGLILFGIFLANITLDLSLYSDYMDKKRHSLLCRLDINADEVKGTYFKYLAEGGRATNKMNFFDIVFAKQVHFFPRNFVRRTSVPVKK